MSDRPARNAIVIGGGIGGLATAIALREMGIEATVYERADAFSEVGAGISLWPNATRVLERLGVLNQLAPRSGRIDSLRVRVSSGRTLLTVRGDRHRTPSLCVYRPDLVAALRDRLPSEACHTGKRLASIEPHADRVVARFEDGVSAEADVLVGADGLRSTVRRHVYPDDADPVYRGYPVYRGVGPPPADYDAGAPSETWGLGVRFGLLDMGGGRAYWYATVPAPTPVTPQLTASESPIRRKEALLERFGDWHDPIPAAIEATPADAMLLSDTYDRPPRRGWSRGRVVLLGDAAHPTTPNLGQGAGMAVEDAVTLAETLVTSPSSQAFAMYERRRYARTAAVTRRSWLIGRLGLATGPLAWLRDRATVCTPDWLGDYQLEWLFGHRV